MTSCMRRTAVRVVRLAVCVAITQAGQGQVAQRAGAEKSLSISGTVREAGNGPPLAGVMVWTRKNTSLVGGKILMGKDSTEVVAKTDSEGRYILEDLPPGQYRVVSPGRFPPVTSRNRDVELRQGSHLSGVDFEHLRPATLRGRIVDEENRPIAGVTVLLAATEYYLGAIQHPVKDSAMSDQAGEYSFRVSPQRAHLLFATERRMDLPAIAKDPADPAARRPVLESAFYGNTPYPEGAVGITLSPGEEREGIDIRMKRVQNLCIEGVLKLDGIPSAAAFRLELTRPSFGMFADGGVVAPQPGGKSGSDGRVRICGLHPGEYRLSVLEPDRRGGGMAGSAAVTVGREDVREVVVEADRGFRLTAQVRWSGEPPAEHSAATDARIQVALMPLSLLRLAGEKIDSRTTVPGTLEFEGLRLEDYAVTTLLRPPELYLKDIRFGGVSIQGQPLRFGGGMGQPVLDLVVGHDPAALTVRVTDDQGKPAGSVFVFLIPAETAAEAQMAARLIQGSASQDGTFVVRGLPPGEWLVIARRKDVDPSLESMAQLWRARANATKVDLPPNGSRQVTVVLAE